MNHAPVSRCASTIVCIDSERENSSGPMSARPTATSYETSWADDRTAPSSAYFEFDDHPARTMPNTPIDDTERISNRPMLTSATVAQPAPNGTSASSPSAAPVAMTGARRNRNLSALSGTMSSFASSFSPSASGWSRPSGPTRIGPRRACMKADTLRSR